MTTRGIELQNRLLSALKQSGRYTVTVTLPGSWWRWKYVGSWVQLLTSERKFVSELSTA